MTIKERVAVAWYLLVALTQLVWLTLWKKDLTVDELVGRIYMLTRPDKTPISVVHDRLVKEYLGRIIESRPYALHVGGGKPGRWWDRENKLSLNDDMVIRG